MTFEQCEGSICLVMHVKVTLVYNYFEDDCVSFDLHLSSVIEKGMSSCFHSYCSSCLAY